MSDAKPPIRERWATVLGLVLDKAGQALLPIGFGLLVGFYVADRGVRLIPTMLGVVMLLGMGALLAIAGGRWLRGKTHSDTPGGTRIRKRIVGVLIIAQLLLGARLVLWWVERPSALTELGATDFETAFELDAQRYREHDDGMDRVLDRLADAGVPPPGGVLTPDQETVLLDSWGTLLDYAIALDHMRRFYEDYYRFDPSRVQRRFHLRSYLLTYAAELSLYEKAARFSNAVLANPNAVKFLDNPHPDRGLPANSFSHFRQDLLGTRDQARVIAGEQYLGFLATAWDARDEARGLGTTWLWRRIETHLATIAEVAPIDRATLTVRADTQLLKRSVRRVWFPIQKEAAELMGDTRVRRIGWYLIDEAQQRELDGHLEPGDVLLSRKNWYLSNVGLPGFWPHAILYLGDPDKLTAYFDDPEVRAWVSQQAGQDMGFAQYLDHTFPAAWIEYRAGLHGETHTVIEAISEGVVFNTMAHAAGDYLAALRPKLSKLAKAQAVVAAFTHQGKPYDFDFDFATDHALVCTELVWRSYRPAQGKAGLDLDLVKVAGRQTLPANEIARTYATELGTDGAQFDFVYFLDARERSREAVVSDEPAFRATWERTKWDIAQK